MSHSENPFELHRQRLSIPPAPPLLTLCRSLPKNTSHETLKDPAFFAVLSSYEKKLQSLSLQDTPFLMRIFYQWRKPDPLQMLQEIAQACSVLDQLDYPTAAKRLFDTMLQAVAHTPDWARILATLTLLELLEYTPNGAWLLNSLTDNYRGDLRVLYANTLTVWKKKPLFQKPEYQTDPFFLQIQEKIL